MNDLITDAFGRNMKPQYDLAQMMKRQRLKESAGKGTPGASMKVNEKVTVQLQTKPKKEE